MDDDEALAEVGLVPAEERNREARSAKRPRPGAKALRTRTPPPPANPPGCREAIPGRDEGSFAVRRLATEDSLSNAPSGCLKAIGKADA
jgi:hypothetical protein